MFSHFIIKILQSMINEIVPICKLLLVNPQPSQQEKVNFGSSKVKTVWNMAPFRDNE